MACALESGEGSGKDAAITARGSEGWGVGESSAAPEGGVEAAVRLQRAGRRRQRGSGARVGSRLQR